MSREEGVESEAGFIKRDSYGVTLEVADIGIYSEVLAYDITSRNVPSPVRTNIFHVLCLIIISKLWRE